MDFATWALVVITGIYVVLTGWLVWISRNQLARQSNPVVCARALSATVRGGAEVATFEVKIGLSILGGSPAVNVSVSGDLKLFATTSTPERSAAFQWATLPVLAVGESQVKTVEWQAPELGVPGRDDREVDTFLGIKVEYFDTAAQDYASVFAASPFSIRTPENASHSRGVLVDAGIFHSQAQSRTWLGRMRRAWRRRGMHRSIRSGT